MTDRIAIPIDLTIEHLHSKIIDSMNRTGHYSQSSLIDRWLKDALVEHEANFRKKFDEIVKKVLNDPQLEKLAFSAFMSAFHDNIKKVAKAAAIQSMVTAIEEKNGGY